VDALSDATGTATEFVHLDFAMKHQLGPLNWDVAFQLTQPWSLLFAPSGAGKTTILRAIAGLLKPQHARIVLRGQIALQTGGTLTADFVLTDTADGVFTPPHKRSIRMVSQNAALFPHLSILRNIRYGIFGVARAPQEREQNEEYLSTLLTICRIEHLTTKAPSQLSNGERQRVALARSLAVPDCSLLLLDEPFTALDATLRDELIADLRVWLARRNTPVLSVTHDIAEAFQLNAQVLKLHEGRLTHQGPAAEVLAEERTRLITQLS
jgi:molybdate transport system ATP-binding protein